MPEDFPQFPTDCRVTKKTATFASSGTKSSVINTSLWRVGAVYLPAEFNSDVITFEGSDAEDGTFAVIMSSAGAAVTFTAAAGVRWYDLPAAVMSFPFIKIVTGSATGGAATINLAFKT
jgi:hypothetical protein